MESLNEDQIVSIEIDLEELKKGELNESFLAMFGSAIQLILGRMFGTGSWKDSSRYRIRGTRKDVTSFAKTLGRESNYIKTLQKYGLNNDKTFGDKRKLASAIAGFEKDTGLKWPFK